MDGELDVAGEDGGAAVDGTGAGSAPVGDNAGTPPVQEAGSDAAVDVGGEGSAADVPADSQGGEENADTPSDDYADLYEKLDDAPADPNAAKVDAALPTAIAEAFKISPYVTKAEDLPRAIAGATELFDVQSGKSDAGEFIDKFRMSGDKAAYTRIVDQARAYIQWAEEQGHVAKAGDVQQEHPDVTALRNENRTLQAKEQERTEAATREAGTQAIGQARSKIQSVFEAKTKGSVFEGESHIHDTALDKMDRKGVDASLARTDFPAWEKEYNRALAEAKNEFVDRHRGFNKRVLGRKTAVLDAVPASPGSGTVPRGTDGRFKPSAAGSKGLSRESFPEGTEGAIEWATAQAMSDGTIK